VRHSSVEVGPLAEGAANFVAYELRLFSLTLKPEHRDEYFHPCNRDHWVRFFCEWLADKQRKSAEVRASND